MTGVGDPLTRITVVRSSESGANLIWTLHHELKEAVQFSQHMPYRKFVNYFLNRDTRADHNFWASYLVGAGASPLFGYAFVQDPAKDDRAEYRLALPQKTRDTTLPATIASEWVQIVRRMKNS
ncbi:hypothetical protein CCHL11_00058 [Colletotrichum chlorophyti]|uniref:Uncharacterized protein n=1 Tax=Colletotrichum chlorophyti TaxID=708187 RepID=A0A1Q8RV58_9PEZI|nr:hypothetical protein CCHL11_00058 [Colletotrichum chlorophyti]